MRSQSTTGVLNEVTRTVHKHKTGASKCLTVCGVSSHLSPDRLRKVPLDRAKKEFDKCGRCFSDGGGY
jgi:hypothetical protein